MMVESHLKIVEHRRSLTVQRGPRNDAGEPARVAITNLMARPVVLSKVLIAVPALNAPGHIVHLHDDELYLLQKSALSAKPRNRAGRDLIHSAVSSMLRRRRKNKVHCTDTSQNVPQKNQLRSVG